MCLTMKINENNAIDLHQWRLKREKNHSAIASSSAIDPEHTPTITPMLLEELEKTDFSQPLWEIAEQLTAKYPEASQEIADRLIVAESIIALSSTQEAIEALSDSLSELEQTLNELPEIDQKAYKDPRVTVLGTASIHNAAPSLSQPAKILNFPRKNQ